MYCRKCGKEIPEDSKFCPECGERLSQKNRKHYLSSLNIKIFVLCIFLLILVVASINIVGGMIEQKKQDEINKIINNPVNLNKDDEVFPVEGISFKIYENGVGNSVYTQNKFGKKRNYSGYDLGLTSTDNSVYLQLRGVINNQTEKEIHITKLIEAFGDFQIGDYYKKNIKELNGQVVIDNGDETIDYTIQPGNSKDFIIYYEINADVFEYEKALYVSDFANGNIKVNNLMIRVNKLDDSLVPIVVYNYYAGHPLVNAQTKEEI